MITPSNARTAGILCNNPDFQKFIGVTCPDSAAAHVRRVCKIGSRRELDTNREAARRFHELRRAFAYEGERQEGTI